MSPTDFHLDAATVAALVSACVTAAVVVWNHFRNQHLPGDDAVDLNERHEFVDTIVKAHTYCQELVKAQQTRITLLEERMTVIEKNYLDYRDLHKDCDVSQSLRQP